MLHKKVGHPSRLDKGRIACAVNTELKWSGQWIRYSLFLIRKIKIACKPHSNNPTMRILFGLGFIQWSIVQQCGCRSFFFFNQQPVTLFEFYCSFLRFGTGLEMEAEFTNPELRGLLYAASRFSERLSQNAGSVNTNTLAKTTPCFCFKSLCRAEYKEWWSTCNNSHINSGFTIKSLYSSVGLNGTVKNI